MKKIITLCIAIFSSLLLIGCEEAQENTSLKAKTDTCKVKISAENFDKNTKITIEEKNGYVEIHAKGHEDVRFDTPATVTFKLDENVKDEDLEKWVGVYKYGDCEYFIEPDYAKLGQGTLEFATYHFSLFGKKKLSDRELADKYAKQLATYEVMREERIKEKLSSGNVIAETANAIYEELGITDETLRGALVRDFVGELSSTVNGLDTSLESDVFKKNAKMAGYGLSGMELLNAAQDGDITAFSSKIADIVVNECCEHWSDIAKKYVPGGIGSIPEALYIAIAEGKPDEASVHVLKNVLSNIPVVKYTQMTAELVDYGVNMWTDSEVELAYEAYSGKSDAAGYKDSPDWDTLMVQMRGAYSRLLINAKKQYCEVNNISMSKLEKDKELCDKLAKQTENALKKQFETRKANDDRIKAKEAEYLNIIKSFENEDVHLMTRGKNGFEKGDDATFRLSRLMNIRNQVIEILGGDDVEHLYSIFGTRDVEKQNRYISQLVETFMKQKNNYEGKKAVIDEVKFVYDKDLTASEKNNSDDKDEDAEFAWVLVATEIERHEDQESDVYRNTYIASENTHIQIDEYIWKDGPYEKATFTAVFDSPPAIIYADREFSLHQSVTCEGETDHYFYASGWYKPESPNIHYGSTSGRPKYEDKDGNACADASSRKGELKGEEFTVTGTLGQGREGDRIGIFYCACGADTRWIYEWKKVGK